MFIELLNFVKEPHELHTQLDKWIYALKREEGEHKKAIKIAMEMLANNESIDKISKYTKLSREEIEALM